MPLKESDLPLGYDRTRITAGILHFGVGHFCRGHLFRYTQRLLALSACESHQYDNWGIIGVNIIKEEAGRRMWEDFKKQECLYTLTSVNSRGGHVTEMIGCMIDFIYAPEEQDRVLQSITDPQIRTVSLTLTEGGYNIDETTGHFDLTNQEVREDLRSPDKPWTVFGFIVEGLRQRRERHLPPFTILSCDNLLQNGSVAKKAILGYAKARCTDLAIWIEVNVSFPNSMFDCIVLGPSPAVHQKLKQLTKLDDLQPVLCEDSSQWVMEQGAFADPPWVRVGQILTENINVYESAKVRVHSASHLLIAFLGLLLGYRTLHEALGDADILTLVDKCLEEDILPTLVVPFDKRAYKNKVISRFHNSILVDELVGVASNGCSKVQNFWGDNVLAVLKRGSGFTNVAFSLACFLEYLHGKNCYGHSFTVHEPRLSPNWKEMILAPLHDRGVLALNVFDVWRKVAHEKLDEEIMKYRKLIKKKGVRGAMPFKQMSSMM